MKILSLIVGHDSSACVIKDGNILFFMEEEKLTYLKKDDLPTNLMQEVKKYVDDEVDVFVLTYINFPGLVAPDVFKEYFLEKNNITPKKTIIEIDHHLMHASCAFYSSGFTEALVFVSDGGGRIKGDWESQEFESVFTELSREKNLAFNVIREEEKSFLKTLDQGLTLLDNIISSSKSKIISGSKCFQLYDTLYILQH